MNILGWFQGKRANASSVSQGGDLATVHAVAFHGLQPLIVTLPSSAVQSLTVWDISHRLAAIHTHRSLAAHAGGGETNALWVAGGMEHAFGGVASGFDARYGSHQTQRFAGIGVPARLTPG